MINWIKDKATGLIADIKRSYKSMTIWVNGVVLTIISLLPLAQDYAPQLKEYLPEDLYKQMMLVVIIANIALRFKTSSSLRYK